MNRKKIARFLGTKIIDNNFLSIDFWSLVHFLSGFFLMMFFMDYILLVILLILYEIFELVVINSGSKFFKPEKNIDIFYDFVFGVLGGFVYVNLFV